MKYILIQNGIYKGPINYTQDLLEKERSISGSEIWFLPENANLPLKRTGDFSPGPIDPRPFPNDIALQAIRNKRDALLAETDWVVLSDVSLSKDKKDALKA